MGEVKKGKEGKRKKMRRGRRKGGRNQCTLLFQRGLELCPVNSQQRSRRFCLSFVITPSNSACDLASTE